MRVTLRRFAVHLPEVLRQSWSGMWRDDVTVYAAGISFHSLTGIFAILLLLSTIFQTAGIDPDFLYSVTAYFRGAIPAQVLELVQTAVRLSHRPVPRALLPVAVVVLLWVGSNVFQAVIHALNRIYHVADTRSAWITRLFALGVLLTGAFFLTLAFTLLTVGGALQSGSEALIERRGGLLEFLVAVHELLSVAAVLVGMLLIYWLAPNFRTTHRIILPGALVFTLTWLATTYVFNFYLRELAVYDKVYGSLATVVIFLTWVYLSALLLLVGGEVNAAYSRVFARVEAEEDA